MKRRTLLETVLGLKDLDRAGWVRAGISRPESVAAHSWGTAWLALALCPPTLDRGRLLALAIVHDLAEVLVGDITPHDDVAQDEKHRREAKAADELLAEHPEIHALWTEANTHASPEARFLRQLDRLDMALQAARYRKTTGVDTAEFIESALAVIEDPELRALLGD